MKIEKIDLDKLNSKDPKIKYGFTKELLRMGTFAPEALYEHFGYWGKMIYNNNNILKWTAIDIIGYISVIDKKNKTEKVINSLFNFLHGGQLITCNHAIFSLGLIAKNKPANQRRIIKEMLAISKDTFETKECKEIAIGKVIESLKNFAEEIKSNKEVMKFILLAQRSGRNATKIKAEALLRIIKKI